MWCPARTVRDLARHVGSRDLYGLTLQAVRLLRIMHLADHRGFLGFLYMNPRLPSLQSQLFRNSFQHALSRGRLGDIAVLTPPRDGLAFLEPEMQFRDGGFEVGFGQMPLAAAFLHLLYLGLMPERFEKICAPLMSDHATDTADTVAAALRKAALDWLQPQLEREHYSRQASALHVFCTQRKLEGPERIDDEVIFGFWESHCENAKVDGFRKFRNAAHKMLVYRRSWIESRTERQIEEAASLDRIATGGSELAAIENLEWTSPLTVLASPPCREAAWITQVDRTLLTHLICDPKLVNGEEAETKEATSLFANEPPSEFFFRTVLRFTFFGALQGILIKGGRTRPYEDFKAVALRMARLESNIRRTIGHAARLLAERRNPTGLRAVIHLFPEIRQTLQDRIEDQGPAALHGLFDMRELTLADGNTTTRKLKAASVDRTGLRPEDIADKDGEEAFAKGTDALLAAHAYLARYLGWLDRQDLVRSFEDDMELFLPPLRRLYGPDAIAGGRSSSGGASQ